MKPEIPKGEFVYVDDVAKWIEQRWDAEVKHRPTVNKNRSTSRLLGGSYLDEDR